MNGIIFQIPHRIWKILEGGKIKSFYSDEANKIHLAGENEDILQRNSQTFIVGLFWYNDFLGQILMPRPFAQTKYFLSGKNLLSSDKKIHVSM